MAGPKSRAVRGALDALTDLFDPSTYYHGTRRDITEFEGGDLGFHFGTPEQATLRLLHTRSQGREGENIIPVRLKMKNPLELPDVLEWDDPYFVAKRIRSKGGAFGKKHQEVLEEIENEAILIKAQYEDTTAWKESQEAQDLLSEIRMLIEGDGYDGIKYLNRVENKMGEVPGLTVEGEKSFNLLNKEYHALQNKIAQRDTPVPADANEAELQQWLDRKPIEPTATETKRFDEIAKEKDQIKETGSYSPYSYITFDPANIRSIFAKFDPTKVKSENILSSVPAAALATGALSELGGE